MQLKSCLTILVYNVLKNKHRWHKQKKALKLRHQKKSPKVVELTV